MKHEWRAEGDAGAAGAGAGDGNTGDGGQQTQPPPGDENVPAWMADLPAELKADKELRKFKSREAALKSVSTSRAEARARPPKGAVVVPDDKSTAEQITAYRAARGIPDAAAGYEISISPPNDPARPEYMPVQGQAASTEKVKELAHTMGLTQDQAVQLAGFLAKNSEDNTRATDTQRAQAKEQEANKLTERYGSDLETKLAMIGPLHAMFGAPDEDGTQWFADLLRQENFPGSLGNSAAMRRFLVNIGEAVRSDRFVETLNGDPSNRGDGDPGPAPIFDYSGIGPVKLKTGLAS